MKFNLPEVPIPHACQKGSRPPRWQKLRRMTSLSNDVTTRKAPNQHHRFVGVRVGLRRRLRRRACPFSLNASLGKDDCFTSYFLHLFYHIQQILNERDLIPRYNVFRTQIPSGLYSPDICLLNKCMNELARGAFDCDA